MPRKSSHKIKSNISSIYKHKIPDKIEKSMALTMLECSAEMLGRKPSRIEGRRGTEESDVHQKMCFEDKHETPCKNKQMNTESNIISIPPPLREWETQDNVINRACSVFRGGMCPKSAGK